MTNNNSSLYGLVLLGGASSRFASPKGLVCIHGIAQWEYMHTLLGALCKDVYFSLNTNTRHLYPKISEENIIYDEEGGGPIAGVYAAMNKEHLFRSAWLIVSVDLFFLNEDTLSFLLKEREEGYDVVLYEYEKLQPLCAVYEQSSYEYIKIELEQGKSSIYKAVLKSKHKVLQFPNYIEYKIHPLININNREELEQISALS